MLYISKINFKTAEIGCLKKKAVVFAAEVSLTEQRVDWVKTRRPFRTAFSEVVISSAPSDYDTSEISVSAIFSPRSISCCWEWWMPCLVCFFSHNTLTFCSLWKGTAFPHPPGTTASLDTWEQQDKQQFTSVEASDVQAGCVTAHVCISKGQSCQAGSAAGWPVLPKTPLHPVLSGSDHLSTGQRALFIVYLSCALLGFAITNLVCSCGERPVIRAVLSASLILEAALMSP